jgi:hypothetical protein
MTDKLIIAHRALLEGPDAALENHPDQIARALSEGFDAEIDAWYLNGRWMLGHSTPDYETNWDLISQPGLWIHCKNIPAFFALRDDNGEHNYFWHDGDALVLTSKGNVWTYYGAPETRSPYSICVMPEATRLWDEIEEMLRTEDWHGYCTDWSRKLRSLTL